MSPEAAAAAVQEEVKNRVEQTKRQVDAKMMQGANELRNAALTVLANPSPSAPGSPPGVRSGNLRRNWNMYSSGGGGNGIFGIQSGMHYSRPSVRSTLSAVRSIPLVFNPDDRIRFTFWAAVARVFILFVIFDRPGSVLSFTDTGISILIVSPIYHVTPFSYSPRSIAWLKQKEKPSLQRANSLLHSAINLGVEICGGAMLTFHRP